MNPWYARGRTLPIRRFVVSGDSMRPGLDDGDGVLAIRSNRAAIGQVRVIRHPDHPARWLVKRVSLVHADGKMEVMSDDPDPANTDSRHFGAVPVDGTYRMVLRVRGERGRAR